MSNIIIVECNSGEKLYVRNTKGEIKGGWISSFLIASGNLCQDTKEDKLFEDWNQETIQDLCGLYVIINKNFYLGPWEYLPNEYDLYRKRSIEPELMTESEFREEVKRIRNTWMDIEKMIYNYNLLKKILQSHPLPVIEGIYHPEHTISEINLLIDTINFLKKRENKKSRIAII